MQTVAALKTTDNLDFVTPAPVKRKRAPKHDFKDGQGRVFAHRHDNGSGWVADTAYVAPTVRVARAAQVSGFARVHDNCNLSGYAHVSGHARLFDCVDVKKNAKIFGNAFVFGHVEVDDFAELAGHARISNGSVFCGRVHVGGNARVDDTQVYGPKHNVRTRISGNAALKNCVINDYAVIDERATCVRSTISNVILVGDAAVINSTLRHTDNSDWWRYCNQIGAPTPANLEKLTVAGQIVSSTLNIAAKQTICACFVHSTLTLHDEQLGEFLRERLSTERTLVAGCTAYGAFTLEQYFEIGMPGTGRREGARVAPAPPPDFNLVRQRRIMRAGVAT